MVERTSMSGLDGVPFIYLLSIVYLFISFLTALLYLLVSNLRIGV